MNAPLKPDRPAHEIVLESIRSGTNLREDILPLLIPSGGIPREAADRLWLNREYDEAQPAIAKAAADKKLSTRQTRDLVKAVKSAPAEKQAEVAEMAAQAANPVEAAEYLSRVAQAQDLADAKPFDHPDVWETSWTKTFERDLINVAHKIATYRRCETATPPQPIRWELHPRTESLEDLSLALDSLIRYLQKQASDIATEVSKRNACGRPNLRVLNFAGPAKPALKEVGMSSAHDSS